MTIPDATDVTLTVLHPMPRADRLPDSQDRFPKASYAVQNQSRRNAVIAFSYGALDTHICSSSCYRCRRDLGSGVVRARPI